MRKLRRQRAQRCALPPAAGVASEPIHRDSLRTSSAPHTTPDAGISQYGNVFAGWFQRAPHEGVLAPDAELLISTLDPLGVADRQGSWSAPGVVLTQTLLHTTAEASRGQVPTVCPHTGNVMVSWIRLDNRRQLCDQLNLPERELSDADIALAAYREWGESMAEHLHGEFSLVIWDAHRHRLHLVRDRLGTRPLFYSITPGVLAFATTQAALRGMPGVDDSEDPMWRAWHTVGRVPHSNAPLALRGARRLPAAHWMSVDAQSQRQERYFEFRDDSPWETRREPHWLEEYRAELKRAVLAATRNTGLLGFETTGGLDSSSVLAMAAAYRPSERDKMHTFGYATAEHMPQFVLETSMMWGVKSNHIFTTWGNPDRWEVARRQFFYESLVGHTCEHGSVLGFWDLLQEVRSRRIRVLLSGYGGDEGVTSHGFEILSEFARARRMDLVLATFPGRLRHFRGIRWLRDRRDSGGRSPTAAAQESAALGRLARLEEDYLGVLGASEIEAIKATVQCEVAVLRTARDNGANALALHQLSSERLVLRLEQSAILAAALGVEYRWPLLDSELIQQYLTTPSIWKAGQGQGRYVHRRAMENILPRRILESNTKKMGRRISIPQSP